MKIYFLTTQSSKNYKSWSGIPYLTHKNLEKKGYKVTNIVFRELFLIKFLFNIPIRVMKRLFKNKTIYFYVRTPLHFFCTYLIVQYIKFSSKDDDVILVQGFSYPPSNKKNKMILMGDWPSEYLFERFLKRNPGFFEKGSVRRENTVIESADAIITFFPEVQDYMKEKFINKNIYHFGNVVNFDEEFSISDSYLLKKSESNRLLFIGRPYYIAGAIELIEAVKELRLVGYDLHVDIVGIEKSLLPGGYEWLSIYGYLDKGIRPQKDIYYGLLKGAKAFVNTTPGWNAFQATLEAMYFCNPIIIRENPIIKKSFPALQDFSYIVSEKLDLKFEILQCFEDTNEYEKKSKTARALAESNTWDNYTSHLIALIENE